MSHLSAECESCFTETLSPIKCLNCNFVCCLTCAQRYITMLPDDPENGIKWKLPECMSCKKQWDDTFIRMNFPKKFVEGELKKFMKAWILNMERNFLQETVAEIERTKEQDKYEIARKEFVKANREVSFYNRIVKDWKKTEKLCNTQIKDFKKQLKTCKDAKDTEFKKEMEGKLLNQQTRLSEILKEKEAAEQAFVFAQRICQHYSETMLKRLEEYQSVAQEIGIDIDEKKEKTTFIKPCPVNDCKGFLSTKYKCALCETHCCADCLEVVGKVSEDKTYTQLKEEHKCDPNNVETAKALKKECKPCPKCGALVFKSSGCDQIWCVCCHTAFSFSTGKVDAGRIHNPHYYEYMRKNNLEIPPYPQGNLQVDGEIGCDLIGYQMFTQKYRQLHLGYHPGPIPKNIEDETSKKVISFILVYAAELFRMIDHLQPYSVRREFSPALTAETRKKYVKNEISEKDWQTQAMRIYKAEEFRNHTADVVSTLVQIIRDCLTQLFRAEPQVVLRNWTDNYGTRHSFAHTTLTIEQVLATLEPIWGFITYLNEYIEDLADRYNYTNYFQIFISKKTDTQLVMDGTHTASIKRKHKKEEERKQNYNL